MDLFKQAASSENQGWVRIISSCGKKKGGGGRKYRLPGIDLRAPARARKCCPLIHLREPNKRPGLSWAGRSVDIANMGRPVSARGDNSDIACRTWRLMDTDGLPPVIELTLLLASFLHPVPRSSYFRRLN